ncbi:BrxA/BrxB family bacilliredoxin [Pseudalkalibacillus salsuginis]|uniref:BrxA/BrxB family bacilliredoxin n=1 Tax=Pseudalkalibacillus salsuginis TaxID=2910972 RepID=UPI001F3A3C57|nr:BrxA/BrxB family bacilliredoxin [Pseudalkalibacillus salsuginis]MCF6408374.1 BrxA/BrxB family bacilliredoxin [Pseudalkalibacillus salsuginis]
MNMNFNMFMNDVVVTARNEAKEAGFAELTTPEEVEDAFGKDGTTLVLVNSVCGCAGGIARPAAAYALQKSDTKPDHTVTVFAGQDKAATEKARSYFTGYPPSSPSFALLKDGKLMTMVERHEIEGSEPIEVVHKLQDAFKAHC